MRRHLMLYAPLALHVIPTLVIGFGFVLPESPIAGFNQYTLGFAAAVLGFIPSYVAGVRLAHRKQSGA
jgi:hypothetical protein